MSDKPYRVPPGWSDEAARLVWEDYRVSLVGDATPPLRAGATFYNVLPGREDACEALVGEGLLVRSRTAPFGYRYVSVDHRLRAWAAVGAPVLAPAEDGKASLAEWVAAADGSALGEPAPFGVIKPHPDAGELPAISLIYTAEDTAEVRVIIDAGHICYLSRDDGEVWSEIDSPAALRAALDALAGER